MFLAQCQVWSSFSVRGTQCRQQGLGPISLSCFSGRASVHLPHWCSLSQQGQGWHCLGKRTRQQPKLGPQWACSSAEDKGATPIFCIFSVEFDAAVWSLLLEDPYSRGSWESTVTLFPSYTTMNSLADSSFSPGSLHVGALRALPSHPQRDLILGDVIRSHDAKYQVDADTLSFFSSALTPS